MKLRKRAAKAAQCTEDVSGDSDSSSEYPCDEDVYEPRQKPRHKGAPRGAPRGRNKKKPAPSRAKKPELLELALHHLDLRSCLDEKTKRSLRLTSKKFRELVEDARALACFEFAGPEAFERFNAYLEIPRSIQRVESISIYGEICISQVNKFILRAPPRLKKLELNNNNDCVEAILCGDFPHLTTFSLHDSAKNESFKLLAQTRWPLQELTLSSFQPPKDNLAAILSNYPELTKLRLAYIQYDVLSEQRFENGLQKLEVLEICGMASTNYLKHHLFHENLQLPSIHTLIYKSRLDCLQHAISIGCIWLKQLRSLTLGSHYANSTPLPLDTFRALMAILEGGPLESLTIDVKGCLNNSWDFVSLPNLAHIDIDLIFTDRLESFNFFDVFSSPHLPMLKKATMRSRMSFPYCPSLSSNGVERFAQAYPHLKSLSLSYQNDILVSPTVLGAIFTHVVPLLEEFSLNCCKLEDDLVGTDIFGIGESAGAKWPGLKRLALDLTTRDLRWAYTNEYLLSVLQQLAAVAHHCPNLRDLKINTDRFSSSEKIKRISEILIEAHAWPLLQRFDCNKHPLWLQLLRDLWPNADFV